MSKCRKCGKKGSHYCSSEARTVSPSNDSYLFIMTSADPGYSYNYSSSDSCSSSSHDSGSSYDSGSSSCDSGGGGGD